MPELPEVETIARGLDREVKGDRIVSIWLGNKPEPLKSLAAEIARVLQGARIAGVRRVGKHIVIDLEIPKPAPVGSAQNKSRPRQTRNGQAQWIVHLGMTGRMLVARSDDPIAKHTHAIATLESGRELRFEDPRRFGRLEVKHDGNFAAAGHEPLSVSLG